METLAVIDDDPVVPALNDFLITDDDFPPNYVNKQHPEDYKTTCSPIPKECIFHNTKFGHSRLIMRCSVKLAAGVFCSISFVLNTGVTKVHLGPLAKSQLLQYGIYCQDDDLGVNYITLMGRKYLAEDTPAAYAPANIIGLRALCMWGLELNHEPVMGFRFRENFEYLEL